MTKLISIFLFLLLSSCLAQEQGEEASPTLAEQLQERKAAFLEKAPQSTIDLYQSGIDRLNEIGLPDQALKLGDTAPNIELNIRGELVPLKTLLQNNHLILTFYRGGWCPYCLIQLKEYEKFYPEFKKLGAELVALAPDQLQEIERTKRKLELSYPLHSDLNHQVARQLGLVYQLDPAIAEAYEQAGLNLQQFQGNDKNELPLSATYIISRDGKVVFRFVDADYTKRAEPSAILEALKAL